MAVNERRSGGNVDPGVLKPLSALPSSFLQAWPLILQKFGFTPHPKAVPQTPPAGLFPKCCIMAFGGSEKCPLARERRREEHSVIGRCTEALQRTLNISLWGDSPSSALPCKSHHCLCSPSPCQRKNHILPWASAHGKKERERLKYLEKINGRSWV